MAKEEKDRDEVLESAFVFPPGVHPIEKLKEVDRATLPEQRRRLLLYAVFMALVIPLASALVYYIQPWEKLEAAGLASFWRWVMIFILLGVVAAAVHSIIVQHRRLKSKEREG